MSNIDNGGPVYPSEQGTAPDGTWNQTYEPGISRRDWLAGLAMQGFCANRTELFTGHNGQHHMAAMAYMVADAMIEASKQPCACADRKDGE